jgi:hypothetical protein
VAGLTAAAKEACLKCSVGLTWFSRQNPRQLQFPATAVMGEGKERNMKRFLNRVRKHFERFTLMCGIMETCDDDVDDERFSSIRSNLAISASRFAISLR